ncbi:putative membrane protein [Clostridium bornimense]|uniref:Putative membrane protein n=2 Tax=Clostridium bornimense TaxID=1216932 RepID=W6S0Y5_9CLOT|nr:putative membrane protein [Clostridium bornimense]
MVSIIVIICILLLLGVTFIHGYKDEDISVISNSIVNTNVTLAEEEKKINYESQGDSTDSIEFLCWDEINNDVFPRETEAEVEDIYTGKKFKIIRTMGDNHADCETITEDDTKVMKEIFGGFNWSKRPIVLHIGGKNYAASMSGMPHAGVDSAPAFAVVGGLSGGYGYGQNLDTIKNNNMDGVFDVHFINSRRHMEGGISDTVDMEHQKNIDIIRSYVR